MPEHCYDLSYFLPKKYNPVVDKRSIHLKKSWNLGRIREIKGAYFSHPSGFDVCIFSQALVISFVTSDDL
jgi:hypothetical protein